MVPDRVAGRITRLRERLLPRWQGRAARLDRRDTESLDQDQSEDVSRLCRVGLAQIIPHVAAARREAREGRRQQWGDQGQRGRLVADRCG
jgi:hypothetical protein